MTRDAAASLDRAPRATTARPDAARLSGWGLAVAIAVLVAFGVMVAYLVGRADADERTWTRLAWLLSSVEAIAFGAAGAVFGASVQRDRAVAAEHRAEKNERDAVAGRTLAETIKAGAPRTTAAREDASGSPPTGAKSAAEILRETREASGEPYVELARRLFPD
jgi:hypothetical protein